jgi:hypothetical protein
MKNLLTGLALAAALAGCARESDTLNIPVGSDVTVQKKDGAGVEGRVVEVSTQQIVVESKDGVKTPVPRAQIASIKTLTALAEKPAEQPRAAAEAAKSAADAAAAASKATTGEAPAAPAAPAAPTAPRPDDRAESRPKPLEFREVTIPAGTVLRVMLTTPVASDTSNVEDPVRGTLQTTVAADGLAALPSGATLLGHVTNAQRSAKVKGRASVAVRFNSIDLPGDGGREAIETGTITRVAPTTKKKDAAKIGIGAGAGAVIGGIVGGGSGAAKGAAIGGGAGTGAVLATRGDEVRLAAGTPLSVKLTAPLTVRVRLK